jgi:hypothetical protein
MQSKGQTGTQAEDSSEGFLKAIFNVSPPRPRGKYICETGEILTAHLQFREMASGRDGAVASLFPASLLSLVCPSDRRIFGQTFLRYPLRSGALACGGPSKRPVEPIDIHRSLASLALQGRVHRREQLRPEFMKDPIYIDVRQSTLRNAQSNDTWLAAIGRDRQ